MIRIFKNLEEYNTFTHNGKNMVSGDLYWVKENKRAFFLTNNIDGEVTSYDMMGEIPKEYIVPSGNIAITENGEGIDVTQYASASVNVPIPEGYIQPSGNKEITANGTNIDVNNYATASVNVPIPDGYIQPSGNIAITKNGENIDVTQYASATVNVPSAGGTGTEDLINLIERDAAYFDIPQGTTKIGSYAFYHYTGIGEITIPDGVTDIGEYAFAYSTITKVTIPSSVKYIDAFAFESCIPLTAIKLLSITPPVIRRSALGNPGDHHILVPAESVDAYKTADNWTNYANYIYAIQGEIVGGDTDDSQHGGEVGGGDTEIEIN